MRLNSLSGGVLSRQRQVAFLDGHNGCSLNATRCRERTIHQEIALANSGGIVNNEMGNRAPARS